MSANVNFVTYCTDYNKVSRLQESLGTELRIIHESQSDFTSDFKSKSSAIYLFMLQQASDSANFAVRLKTIGDVRWVLDRYEADGIFAKEVSENAKNIKHIHTPLCYYNYLDPNRRP